MHFCPTIVFGRVDEACFCQVCLGVALSQALEEHFHEAGNGVVVDVGFVNPNEICGEGGALMAFKPIEVGVDDAMCEHVFHIRF